MSRNKPLKHRLNKGKMGQKMFGNIASLCYNFLGTFVWKNNIGGCYETYQNTNR